MGDTIIVNGSTTVIQVAENEVTLNITPSAATTITVPEPTYTVNVLTSPTTVIEVGGGGGTGRTVTVQVGTTTTGSPGSDAQVTNSGDDENVVLNFVIPAGIQGEQGEQGNTGATGATGATGSPGAAATISVGTTTTGAAGSDAEVTNSGTSSAAILNFTIPQGVQGEQGNTGATGATGAAGAAATISVGTTTTGAAGSDAEVTNSGTSSAAVFNFTIPQGIQGNTGATGATGAAGPNEVTSSTSTNLTGYLTGNGSTCSASTTIPNTSVTGLGTASTFSSSAFAQTANNLSDLASESTARTNLGLGSLATQSSSTTSTATNLTGFISGNGSVLSASSTIPNTDITGLGTASTYSAGTFAKIANNLSDLASTNTALNNLLPSQSSQSGKFLTTNGTSTSWAAGNSGTVTSVGLSVPSFLSVSGSPVTTSGTLAVSLSGTALPVANGGTGQTTTSAALNALLPSQTGNSGDFLTTNGTSASWASVSGGTGTVTSVGMTVPSILSVSGSPITTSGTLAVSLANQTTNEVLASPNGSTGTPTFRSLVKADLPTDTAYTDVAQIFSAAQEFTAGVEVLISDTNSSTTSTSFAITHNLSSGTAANGMGVALAGNLQNASGTTNQNAGQVNFYWHSALASQMFGGVQLIPFGGGGSSGAVVDVNTGSLGNQLGFFSNAPVTQQTGDVATALSSSKFGLMGSAPYYNATGLYGQSVWNNLIGNANFNIWQRGTSLASVTNATYLADRWEYLKGGSATAVHTYEQSTTVPTVSQSGVFSEYSLQLATTTAQTTVGTSDYTGIGTSIEGYDWQLLAQRAFTLSFWIYATTTGTYSVALRNSGLDHTCVMSFTVSTSNTWQFVTLNIPASTSSGTWNYTNGVGLNIFWPTMCGTTLQTTAGSWVSGNYLAATGQANNNATTSCNYLIAQVMIQPGTVTNPVLQPLAYQQDLARCERYYCQVSDASIGVAQNSARATAPVIYPVTMRLSTPTLVSASFSVNSGSAGTPSVYTSDNTQCMLWNSASNWTSQALLNFAGGFSCDF